MVEELKFFGTTLTNQNSIQEDNHCILQSGNTYCHFVKNLSKIVNIKTLRTVTLSFILYGYENWSLTLKEEHLLRVFQGKIRRRIFRPKRDGVAGEWRKLYNEELNEMYSSPNPIRVIKF